MNKGELMREVYTEEELRQIDSALPKEYWDGVNKDIQVDTFYHVMNYNDNGAFGKLEDMRVIAKQRQIKIN